MGKKKGKILLFFILVSLNFKWKFNKIKLEIKNK